ncbi:purple acid phosphatase-like, partial [Trifolium medium]|nr:purple acid phosphatase-like [Trifolium medium]
MSVCRGLSFPTSFLLLALVVLNLVFLCNGGTTSTFVRKVEKGINMSLDSDVFAVPSGYNAPQQVHITQGDLVGKSVIVSWVTEDEQGSNAVRYWSAENSSKQKKMLAKGKIVTYRFFNYSSGFIH